MKTAVGRADDDGRLLRMRMGVDEHGIPDGDRLISVDGGAERGLAFLGRRSGGVSMGKPPPRRAGGGGAKGKNREKGETGETGETGKTELKGEKKKVEKWGERDRRKGSGKTRGGRGGDGGGERKEG